MDVIAVFVSDIHLSDRMPSSRDDADWLAAQEAVLNQLRGIVNTFGCELIYCGDIFDHWNTPVSAVNWAIRALPPGYAIPGQHDLPYHRYSDIKKSAFWTLCEAGILVNIEPGKQVVLRRRNERPIYVSCFPWGADITPPQQYKHDGHHIAVAHRYVWVAESTYSVQAAPPETNLDSRASSKLREALSHYKVAFFGDNHIPFARTVGNTTVVNCGCLIRRGLDEFDISPRIWLLHDDMTVSHIPVNVEHERWRTLATRAAATVEIPAITELLGELQNAEQEIRCINYRDAVEAYITTNNVREGVKNVLLEALGDS